MNGGGAEGSRDGGSSDPRKRKGDKKKDDKAKERRRGYGVAKLEMMRVQNEMAEQFNKQNSLRQGSPQIPDGTTDGLDIAAIRASSYPWSMHANVSPSLPLPHYPPHLAMAYGSANAVRGATNFGRLQSTPFRPPGASGAAPYPNPNNIRPPGALGETSYANPNIIRPLGASGEASYPNPNNIRPLGASGAASYLNPDIIRPSRATSYPNPNNTSPPGASGAASNPYSNNIMPFTNEVKMTQPFSEVPNRQEYIIDLTREEEFEGHNKSTVESTSKNSNDPEDPDLELKL